MANIKIRKDIQERKVLVLKFILTLASGISDGLKALWTLEKNDNNKKLQFEASHRVVHKRSTSQNVPIWEHRRSSSVILSFVQFFGCLRYVHIFFFYKI